MAKQVMWDGNDSGKQAACAPINGALIGGLILIFGGALALVAQFIPDRWGLDFGLFILLGLGAAFLAAGILTREAGWLIPGGILSGIGAGVALTASPLAAYVPDRLIPGDEGGLFLIAFGGGWFLITALSLVFTRRPQWWPVIPGAILTLIGLSAAFGGVFETVLVAAARFWPVALIVLGAWVLFRSRRAGTTIDR